MPHGELDIYSPSWGISFSFGGCSPGDVVPMLYLYAISTSQ